MSLPQATTVRRARSEDLDAIARLWHESATDMEGAVPNMPSCRALRERIDREIRAGWDLRVAERGGRLVGMMAMIPAESILDQLFVSTAAQGSGVGALLLAAAKQEMATGFTLRMTRGNGRALRFYEGAGLAVASDGLHPKSGSPVRFMRWDGRAPDRDA